MANTNSYTATAFRASDFLDSLGVNAHAGHNTGAYQNSSLIVRSLDYLGIHSVRDNFTSAGGGAQVLGAVASAGVKFDFVVSSALPANGAAGLAGFVADLKSFAAQHPGALISVEGLNEANLYAFKYNGSSSMAAAAAFQKDLYQAIKADPALKGVSVLNLTVGNDSAADHAAIGDLSAYADYANAHTYTTTGATVDSTMEKQLALAQKAASADRIVVTETGYTTHDGVLSIGASETAQATLVLRNVLDAFENGSAKTYLYELLDSAPAAGVSAKEEHFGLFRADGSAKPAATAIHNLTTILSHGDKGAAGAQSHGYDLKGMPAGAHVMALEKSGGVYDIVLWNETPVWNGLADLLNLAKTVTVTLDKVESVVRIYDPVKGTTPIATYYNVKSFDVALGDHPLIVDVGAPSAVTEIVGTSAPTVSMTAAEFVGGLVGMAVKTGLEVVKLAGDHVLEVSSVATMKDMIANYGGTLSKIEGGYSFSVKVEQPTWREVTNYDSKGVFVRETDYSLNKGVIVSKFVTNADGSKEAFSYGLKNLNYTEQKQSFDASGKLVALVRSHADGSLAYTETRSADGTAVFGNYDALGGKTSIVTVKANGERSTDTFTSTGALKQTYVQNTDGSTATTIYADGVKTTLVIKNPNGTSSFDNYNIKGQSYATQHQDVDASGKVVGVVRKHADGSLDYTESTKAGVKTYDYYDAKGALTNHTVVEAGKQSSTIYTAGVKTAIYVTNVDGSKETHTFALKNLSYTEQHQTFDKSGKLTSLVRNHADGSLDSTETRSADGTAVFGNYDALGAKTSVVTIKASGERTTDTFTSAGALKQTYLQSKDGSTTTTTYADGVKTSLVVKASNGSASVDTYNIKGQSYVTQHQDIDATGKVIAVVRKHADGSLDYTETTKAGVKTYDYYDAKGVLTNHTVIGTDALSTTTLYNKQSSALSQTVVQNKNGSTSTTEFANGIAVSLAVKNADGSSAFDTYNIKGQSYVTQHQDIDATGKVIAVVRKHADGSLDYTETTKAGVKTYDYYDAKGVLTNHTVVDRGDQSTTIYANGAKSALYVTHADGSKETYAYGLKNLSYTQQVQSFDQSGQLVSLVRSHADGTLDSTQTRAADGSMTYATYDAVGRKLSVVVVEADGDRVTDTYDAASGLLTRHYEQNADGSTETTSYVKGVKTQEVVTHTDGTSEFLSFNIKGQTYATQHQTLDASGKVVSVVRTHADGTLDYKEINDADGSRTVSTYNASGALTSTVETEKTGERDVFLYSADGSTRHEAYNASKAIVSIDILSAKGSHSVTGYANGMKLVGGVGDDTYFLFGDKQTVVFHGGDDTVKSFNFQSNLADHIEISRSIAHSFLDLTVKQSGADVLVTFAGHDDSLLLAGVKAAQVTSDYFLFA